MYSYSGPFYLGDERYIWGLKGKDRKLFCMKETLKLAIMNQSLTIIDCFLKAFQSSFEREVQKQTGSNRGGSTVGSVNKSTRHLHWLRREKINTRPRQTQCLLW